MGYGISGRQPLQRKLCGQQKKKQTSISQIWEDAEETVSPEMDMPEVEEPAAEEMPVEEVQPVVEEMPAETPAPEPAKPETTKPEVQKEAVQQPAPAPAESGRKAVCIPAYQFAGT